MIAISTMFGAVHFMLKTSPPARCDCRGGILRAVIISSIDSAEIVVMRRFERFNGKLSAKPVHYHTALHAAGESDGFSSWPQEEIERGGGDAGLSAHRNLALRRSIVGERCRRASMMPVK